MSVKWVNLAGAMPVAADFTSTRGWGTPIVIDTSTNLAYYLNANEIVTQISGGTVAWGDITGTLSDQTDLQAALDAKLSIEPEPAWGGTSVRTEYRTLSVGDNAAGLGTLTFVWNPIGGTGLIEIDLAGYTGGAMFGGALNATNDRVLMSVYGTITGWEFVDRPYYGTSPLLISTDVEDDIIVAMSDETTAITTGAAKMTIFATFDMEILEIFSNIAGVSSSGAVVIDVNVNGVSVFSTNPSIAVGDDCSLDAGSTDGILTSTPLSVSKGDKITFDIDSAGTGAVGCKANIRYRRVF